MGHEDCTNSERSIFNNNNKTSSKSQSSSTSNRIKHSTVEAWNKCEDVLLEEIMHDDYVPEKRINAIQLNIKLNETTKA